MFPYQKLQGSECFVVVIQVCTYTYIYFSVHCNLLLTKHDNKINCQIVGVAGVQSHVTTLIMAKKVKTINSLLDELDKLLFEGKWREVDQTLKKAKKKSAIPESFACFLQGVEEVENHLLGEVYERQGASASLSNLTIAEAKLKESISRCEPGHDASLQQLANIKYGQLLWLKGSYSEALVALQEVQTTADTSLLHTCKVLMEGNLYLALCMEQASIGNDDSTKLSVAVSAYEEALRLSLLLIHNTKHAQLSSPGFQHPAALKTVKIAVERAPILALRLKNLLRCLNVFRRVLQSRDEDVLADARMVCTTSLSSLLLFHTCPETYTPPAVTALSAPSPHRLEEEAILVSLLAKAITDSWTVSKDDPVPSPAVIFDLVTVVLSSVGLRGQVVQVLEDSMRFACDLPHIWLQFALALVANNQKEQALAVFHECIKLSPDDPLTLATAANFALEKVTNSELCIKWATKATEVARGHFLEGRVHCLLGRGYTLQSQRELSSQKRGELHKLGLVNLKKAVDLDPRSVEYSFHLALQLAESREITHAISEVQRALALNSGHTSCLHLLALILSSQKKYEEALKVCDIALVKQPGNFGLLECKTKLEVVTISSNQALKTCKHALQLWQKMFSAETTGLIGIVTQEQHSLSEIPLVQFERTETMIPDIASDAGSSHFSLSVSTANKPHSSHPYLLQARIWCTIAEVFLESDKISDAASCVREAQYLAPHLSTVLITFGRVLEAEKKSEQALEQYRSALSLQPGNPTALALIGRLLHKAGKQEEAEKYLRESTSIDQLSHESWYWLGEVFAAQNEFELSADCFKTALKFEETTPLQPFSAVLSSFIPAS